MTFEKENYHYQAIDPIGNTYNFITDLKDFCILKGLNYKGVRKKSYVNGCKHYNGWKFCKVIGKINSTNNNTSRKTLHVNTNEIGIKNSSLYNLTFGNKTYTCKECGDGNFTAIDLKSYVFECVACGAIYNHLDQEYKEETKLDNPEFDRLKGYGLDENEILQQAINENSKLKKQIKELTIENSLTKILSSVIKESVSSLNYNYKTPVNIISNKKSKIQEEAILLLSDLHADEVVKPESVGNMERFDFGVACRRAEVLVDSSINILKSTFNNYQYDTLNLILNGDLVQGTIHNSVNCFENAIKGAMATGELISNMILDFANHFKKIKVSSVSGNHGRFDNKKNYNAPKLNWDYLVAYYAIARLQNLIDSGVLEYELPESWSHMISIYNYNIMIFHGDDIKSFQGIPFYGIARKTSRLNSLNASLNKKIDYYMVGHFHNSSQLTEVGSTTIMNGSFTATDAYAYNSLSVCSDPSQMLMSINPNRGITWRLPIKLRGSDNWLEEEAKVGRYNIKLLGDK